MKILYCCPFAHYSGHPPWATENEPEALARAGVDIKLLTFCGIMNGHKAKVPEEKVANDNVLLKWLRKYTITRWPVQLMETILTTDKAIDICFNENRVLHLRDGEPFFFVLQLLGLGITKKQRWLISLMGSNLFAPYVSNLTFKSNPSLWLYSQILRFINSKVWKPLYWINKHFHTISYITQNNAVTKAYLDRMPYMVNNVTTLPMGSTNSTKPVPKAEARSKLNLPQDKVILLSFGAPHPGKDLGVVFEVAKMFNSAAIVCAGTQVFSLGSNPSALAKKYNIEDRTFVFDYYIPEEDKVLFFSAADACILSYTPEFSCTASMLWESCKFRLPVIASDIGQLGELVNGYNLGLTFNAGHRHSLMASVSRLMDLVEYNLLEGLRENCDKFNRDHSIDKWAEGCKEIYSKL